MVEIINLDPCWITTWCCYNFSDFTIISGDSLGKTQIWDGKLGTLIKVIPWFVFTQAIYL
jgi:hypothetical protein